jgi:Cdc6-like AAA superfamily ATPase
MEKITWYQEFGFYNNPFSIKPGAYSNDIYGQDDIIKDVISKVANSNMIYITGPYGTGKTSILKRIIHEFKGKKRIIYYNCNQKEKSINFDSILINAGGFFHKFLGIRKKNMILLLDEVQDLNKKDMHLVVEYYKLGFFKSVILASKKDDIELSSELIDTIGRNRYDLREVTSEEAIKIIRKRIGNISFLTDETIIAIFKKNKNPRAFLKNCEDVCRFSFESGAKKVSEKDIDLALKS